MITTDIMQDASEIVHYHNPCIPFYIELEWLSSLLFLICGLSVTGMKIWN